MRIIARDFINKTSIFDAIMSVWDQFGESTTITIVGMPDAATNSGLKTFKFKLCKDVPQSDVQQGIVTELEKAYCWSHVEVQVGNDSEANELQCISVGSLQDVMKTWICLNEMLLTNETDFEDYFYKVNTQKKSSYTLTRDELMLLLSLQGGQTLRQVLLSKRTNPADLLTMLFNSLSHKLLTKTSYDPNADYALAIKVMGDRINIFVKNAILSNESIKGSLSDLFMRDLVLLTVKYPDTECINVSGNTVDVSETVSALTLTKDTQYACSIGSSILKPLNIVYASIASSLVWTFGFDRTVDLLIKTDKELIDKYKGVKSDKKTHFIRSS